MGGNYNHSQSRQIAKSSKRRPAAPTNQGPSAQYEQPDLLALQRAVVRPDLARPADILALQRTVGNRAVTQLLARNTQTVVQRDYPDEPDSPAPFKRDNIAFASVRENIIGSIYFKPGRIRLVHESGPEISEKVYERYTVEVDKLPPGALQDFYRAQRNYLVRKSWLQQYGKIAEVGDKGDIFELRADGGKHKSRGSPEQLTLSKAAVNVIYNVVNNHPGDNDELKEQWEDDIELSEKLPFKLADG